MKQKLAHKIIPIALILAITAVLTLFSTLIWQSYKDYRYFKVQNEQLEQQLIQSQAEYDSKKSYLKQFFMDPQFFQWVVKKRLGYASRDEVIFHFKDLPPHA